MRFQILVCSVGDFKNPEILEIKCDHGTLVVLVRLLRENKCVAVYRKGFNLAAGGTCWEAFEVDGMIAA